MRNFDFESVREILADDTLHILLALVKRVVVAPDRSTCRVLVSVLPEKRELVAEMSWEAVGANAGFFMMPNVNDLVLVAQAEGDKDQAFVVRRLTSTDDKIPINALDGDFVLKAIDGKKVWVTASRINLTKGDGTPSENLVLGQMLKQVLSKFLQAFSVHKHIGNLGYVTAPPDNVADATSLKSDFVDNEKILSNIAFTEKG